MTACDLSAVTQRVSEWRRCVHLVPLLVCAFTIACSGLGHAQSYFQRSRESYTNVTGVLRRNTVYQTNSESHQQLEWVINHSWSNYELYPLPAQTETNRLMTLSGRDRQVLEELRLLVGARVKVEGRLVEHFRVNEKGETYHDRFHLVITSVTDLEPLPKTSLNSQQAHVLAKRLAASRYDLLGEVALQRSAPPQLLDGRWVWVCRQGIGRGDVEATVTFAENGSSPQFDWRSFSSETYIRR